MDEFKQYNIKITNPQNNYFINNKKFRKMWFINNAIDNGWSVNKQNNSIIFSKKHNNDYSVLKEQYITDFIKEQFKDVD
jgi:hypothetical protein